MSPQPNWNGVVLSAAALLFVNSQAGVAAPKPPDLQALAEKIVAVNAGVNEGDHVVVRGDVRDVDLLEEISLAVWKHGAEPLVLMGRDKTYRRYFDEVPAKFDGKPLSFALKIVEAETVDISVDSDANPGLFADVAPERMLAVQERFQAIGQARLQRGVRTVHLGNDMYPTEATARRYGLSVEKLAELFWGGIGADPRQLQASGEAIKALLGKGKVVHITHANGTDFKVRVEGRPVTVSDGVISKEDMERGGAATQVWLPAGEVFVTPVAGTAEGTIIFDLVPTTAGDITNAKYIVKAGKLLSHAADPTPGYDRWKALYESAGDRKNEFGFVDIGLNPAVTVPPASKFTSWIAAGIVNLGFGANVWAGGSNDVAFAFGGTLTGCTVRVDEKIIVKDGHLAAAGD